MPPAAKKFTDPAGIPGRALLLRAIIQWLPIAVAVAGMSAFYVHAHRREEFSLRSAREYAAVLAGRASIRHTLAVPKSDLAFMARVFERDRLCGVASSKRLDGFAQLLLAFSSSHPDYDQLRWIDAGGMERVRINRGGRHPSIVPRDRLQDKAGRYYFRRAVRLAPGGIYASPFDLNVEHGCIERPYKPMIRFATPVHDQHGACGIIVFNYLGAHLIHGLLRAVGPADQRLMLVNADGYYLHSPRAGEAWGFMFHKKGLTLAAAHPRAWRTIRSRVQGQFSDRHGLWTFATIDPVTALRAPGPWKLVTYLGNPALYKRSAPLQREVWTTTSLFLAVLLGFSWRMARNRLERDRLEARLAVQAAEYADLYENAPCGYHSVDEGGRVIRINQTQLEWQGYAREELLGKRIHELYAPASQARVADKLERLKQGGSIHDMELELVRRDGTHFPVLLNASAIHDGDGRFVMSRSTLLDLSDRKVLERKLEMQAHHDALTGLRNRGYFYELAGFELARSRRLHSDMGLMLLDIDHFKRINDTYGHAMGDAVLKRLAATATHILREIDIVARWGGEEFVVLLPGATGNQVLEVAERLRSAIAASHAPGEPAGDIPYTASIGITSRTDDAEGIHDMIKRADEAMYAAKHAGRNCVRTA